MELLLFIYLYFAIPFISLIWFIAALISFLRTDKENELRRRRRILLICSAVTSGICVFLHIFFIFMFSLALRNM